jgi:hypothetical protein
MAAPTRAMAAGMAKDTVHWDDDDATVFGSGEVGFCRVGDCMGKKVRSAHPWKERVSS